MSGTARFWRFRSAGTSAPKAMWRTSEGYYNGPVYTPAGRPVLLTIEDACPEADMVDDDPASIDCGSCRHYHQFPSSLLGVCQNEKLQKKGVAAGAARARRTRRR